jgi:hypothetical protein
MVGAPAFHTPVDANTKLDVRGGGLGWSGLGDCNDVYLDTSIRGRLDMFPVCLSELVGAE